MMTMVQSKRDRTGMGTVMALFLMAVCLSGVIFLKAEDAVSSEEGMKRIILLKTMPVRAVMDQSRWFVTQLRELGYEENKNMDLVELQADGDRDLAVKLLKEAAAEGRPDLVATSATLASQMAAEVFRGTGIPQVFFTVSDPVGAGIIPEIGKPTGTRITGKVHMIERETRINIVMQLIGEAVSRRPVRIGFIHSAYPSSEGDIRELLQEASQRNDIEFKTRRIEYRKVPEGTEAMLAEVKKAMEALSGQVDCWWEPAGPLGELDAYTRVLLEGSDRPIVMGTKLSSVQIGALLHLTPSAEHTGREAARLADIILKGADPGTIPPVPPASFDLGLNLKTALKYNIVVPPELIRMAGDQIFQ